MIDIMMELGMFTFRSWYEKFFFEMACVGIMCCILAMFRKLVRGGR